MGGNVCSGFCVLGSGMEEGAGFGNGLCRVMISYQSSFMVIETRTVIEHLEGGRVVCLRN